MSYQKVVDGPYQSTIGVRLVTMTWMIESLVLQEI